MRIKKIIANSLSEGKVLIKKELGEDAIILSTRNIKNTDTGKESLEIVAAIDEKTNLPQSNELIAKHQNPEISSEIINRLIETISYPYLEYLSPELRKNYKYFKDLGFEDNFIGSLLREVSSKVTTSISTEDLLNLIIAKVKTENLFTKKISRKLYGFIGPDGVGKTSSLLKFATVHKLMNASNILIVGADNYNFGANEKLAAYCKVLDLNFIKAGTELELKNIIENKKNYDLILIDFDSKSTIINSNIENILLLPINGNRTHIERQLKKYSGSYVAFTGLDEPFEIQRIIDLLIDRNLTFCFYTNGSKIPDDLELADSNGIKKMMINNGQ